MMGFWDAAASERQLQLWQFLAGYPPNFVFLLCACSSVVAMWKINSLSLYNTSSLNFYRPDPLPDDQLSVKALKATEHH